MSDECLRALALCFLSEEGRNGFAHDFRHAAATCKALWAEEAVWSGLARLQRGERRRTHLMFAAKRGDAARLRWLIARGGRKAPPRGCHCSEPLCVCDPRFPEWLDAEDDSMSTALAYAAAAGSVECVKTLLSAGATPHSAWKALAARDSLSGLRLLLDAAGSEADSLAASPAMGAALLEVRSVEPLRFLLQRSAKWVNEMCVINGATPLVYAAMRAARAGPGPATDVMRMLVAAGADELLGGGPAGAPRDHISSRLAHHVWLAPRAQQLVAALGLERHPEGGYFKRIYTSTDVIPTARGPRPAATMIHYLLPTFEISRLHSLRSDETWLFHEGDALEVVELAPGEAGGAAVVTRTSVNANRPAYTVRAREGVVFGAAVRDLIGSRGFTHVTCVVCPGFDFNDWKMPTEEELMGVYAGDAAKAAIAELGRPRP